MFRGSLSFQNPKNAGALHQRKFNVYLTANSSNVVANGDNVTLQKSTGKANEPKKVVSKNTFKSSHGSRIVLRKIKAATQGSPVQEVCSPRIFIMSSP